MSVGLSITSIEFLNISIASFLRCEGFSSINLFSNSSQMFFDVVANGIPSGSSACLSIIMFMTNSDDCQVMYLFEVKFSVNTGLKESCKIV